jgi:hypothetical protein
MALSSHRRLLVPHINKKSPGTRPGLLATQEIACDDLERFHIDRRQKPL